MSKTTKVNYWSQILKLFLNNTVQVWMFDVIMSDGCHRPYITQWTDNTRVDMMGLTVEFRLFRWIAWVNISDQENGKRQDLLLLKTQQQWRGKGEYEAVWCSWRYSCARRELRRKTVCFLGLYEKTSL